MKPENTLQQNLKSSVVQLSSSDKVKKDIWTKFKSK